MSVVAAFTGLYTVLVAFGFGWLVAFVFGVFFGIRIHIA